MVVPKVSRRRSLPAFLSPSSPSPQPESTPTLRRSKTNTFPSSPSAITSFFRARRVSFQEAMHRFTGKNRQDKKASANREPDPVELAASQVVPGFVTAFPRALEQNAGLAVSPSVEYQEYAQSRGLQQPGAPLRHFLHTSSTSTRGPSAADKSAEHSHSSNPQGREVPLTPRKTRRARCSTGDAYPEPTERPVKPTPVDVDPETNTDVPAAQDDPHRLSFGVRKLFKPAEKSRDVSPARSDGTGSTFDLFSEEHGDEGHPTPVAVWRPGPERSIVISSSEASASESVADTDELEEVEAENEVCSDSAEIVSEASDPCVVEAYINSTMETRMKEIEPDVTIREEVVPLVSKFRNKRIWIEMATQGIWPHVFGKFRRIHTINFGRSCKYGKLVAEPFIYQKLWFYPRQPHVFSYAHLLRMMTGILKYVENNVKIEKFTKEIWIYQGWELNEIKLLVASEKFKQRRIKITDKIHIGAGELLLGDALMEHLNAEGRQQDGGVSDINMAIQALVFLARKLEFLKWQSPIPITHFLGRSRLEELTNLTMLHLDLGQNEPEELRDPNEPNKFYKVPAEQYFPRLSFWASGLIPLRELNLYNLSAKKPHWWNELYTFISSVAGTLEILGILMADAITPERYPTLYTKKPNPKTSPPTLHFPPTLFPPGSLNLKQLYLKGLILTSSSLLPAIVPANLELLSIKGCFPSKFTFPPCLTSFRNLKTDNWAFLEPFVLSAPRKLEYLTFTPSATSGNSGLLGRLLISSVPCITRVELSEKCILPTKTLLSFLDSGSGVKELKIAILREQWGIFEEHVTRLVGLRKLHVLVDEQGVQGGRKGNPFDDCEDLAYAIPSLVGVGMNGFEWSVTRDAEGEVSMKRSNYTPVVPKKGQVAVVTLKGGKVVEKEAVDGEEVVKMQKMHRKVQKKAGRRK